MDWSPMKAGRLATADCRAKMYVWEPQVGAHASPHGMSLHAPCHALLDASLRGMPHAARVARCCSAWRCHPLPADGAPCWCMAGMQPHAHMQRCTARCGRMHAFVADPAGPSPPCRAVRRRAGAGR